MNQSIKNGFCPKCGALMRQNVCQSCEFSIDVNLGETGWSQPQFSEENVYSNIPQSAENQKSNKTGLIVGLIIGGLALVLIVGILVVAGIYYVLNSSVMNSTDIPSREEEYYYDDLYEYEYSDEYENNENEYFEEFDTEIKEPADAEEKWKDIWDTPENLE